MLRRLRSGEWIAVGGLIGLAVSLFLSWFTATVDLRCDLPTSTDGGGESRWCPFVSGDLFSTGWSALGRPWMDILIVAVIAVVIALVMTLRAGPGRPTYGAVVSLIVAGAVTFLVTVLTAIRVLLARPSIDLPRIEGHFGVDVSTGIGPGGWVGLASLVIVLIGLWVAVADDRTDAADSAFDPPAPRPVPDVAASSAGDAPAPTPEV